MNSFPLWFFCFSVALHHDLPKCVTSSVGDDGYIISSRVSGPVLPQWHAAAGMGLFFSGCSWRPHDDGSSVPICCVFSTTIDGGARRCVESSQCTTISAKTDGALIDSSCTTGEGSFVANGTTTRSLVLLSLGIMRLCRFHFSHDPRSHVQETGS